MGLNSPVISDEDSLIEKAPLQNGDERTRGNVAYSTFTRKRPENLPNYMQKKKRQSLMSPLSIPNLDSDGLMTPEFTMTQSMYEPTEKKKQQAKLDANSKLLNLIASEKSAQAAKERKLKEMNKRLNQNRKRNEEKQRLAEERRLRIIADQDAKKQRILNKISSPSPLTASCYGNNKTVFKYKNSMGSGFLDKRPISSTGKIFGFGSSAPRDVCERWTPKKLKIKDLAFHEVHKPETPASRMCASQIVRQFTYESESKTKKHIKSPKAYSEKPVSASTFSISNSNRSLAKNHEDKVLSPMNNYHVKPKMKPKTSGLAGIKSPISHSNTKDPSNSTTKPPVPKRRERSAENNKYNSNIRLHPEPRSRTLDRKVSPPENTKIEPLPIAPTIKKRIKPESKKPTKPKPEYSSVLKKSSGVENISENHTITSPGIGETDTLRKQEVRFEENESYKEEDISLLSQSSISTERPRSSTNNLTEDEYKQRIALQRKLAKEKRRKEQEEKERIAAKEQEEIKLNEVNNDSLIEDLQTENSSCEIPEFVVNEIQNDSSVISKKEIFDDGELKKDLRFNEIPENLNLRTQVPSDNISRVNFTKSEASDLNGELTASTETLDRRERRKRLDTIMSRIKKPIGGSTENVTHHLSTTTLQDMLDKGHLSGMSKTAAILMKNAHQTSELSSSATELHIEAEQNKSPVCVDLSLKDSLASENPEVAEQERGSCDGQEDLIAKNELPQSTVTKSNLMDNLVTNSNKPYLSSWQEKYSNSYSLDADEEEEYK